MAKGAGEGARVAATALARTFGSSGLILICCCLCCCLSRLVGLPLPLAHV